MSTECELPDWGVFSFESKVSGAELKEEVGEVEVGSRDARKSRMRVLATSLTSARLVNLRGSNKLFANPVKTQHIFPLVINMQ